jgi:hypothetical protein
VRRIRECSSRKSKRSDCYKCREYTPNNLRMSSVKICPPRRTSTMWQQTIVRYKILPGIQGKRLAELMAHIFLARSLHTLAFANWSTALDCKRRISIGRRYSVRPRSRPHTTSLRRGPQQQSRGRYCTCQPDISYSCALRRRCTGPRGKYCIRSRSWRPGLTRPFLRRN